MTPVDQSDLTRTRGAWVARKQKKPLTMNLNLTGDAAAAAAAGEEAGSELGEAEQMLHSLGFAVDHWLQRIPRRFLHPSKVKGIDFDCRILTGKSANPVTQRKPRFPFPAFLLLLLTASVGLTLCQTCNAIPRQRKELPLPLLQRRLPPSLGSTSSSTGSPGVRRSTLIPLKYS